jgi:hypothetical protein
MLYIIHMEDCAIILNIIKILILIVNIKYKIIFDYIMK